MRSQGDWRMSWQFYDNQVVNNLNICISDVILLGLEPLKALGFWYSKCSWMEFLLLLLRMHSVEWYRITRKWTKNKIYGRKMLPILGIEPRPYYLSKWSIFARISRSFFILLDFGFLVILKNLHNAVIENVVGITSMDSFLNGHEVQRNCLTS